jgi:O-methyltransferase
MIKAGIARLFNSLGYRIVRTELGFSRPELETYQQVQEYTATTIERLVGLVDAVRYVSANRIEGDVVECGVWRGGSIMAAMHALIKMGDLTRHFHLFDTFEGMTEPTEKDVMYDGQAAKSLIDRDKATFGQDHNWCVASLDDVRKNVLSTGYPKERVHFIHGKVEQTIPQHAPAKIALLRLDTDWYDSTAHELVHLYPRLTAQGVLIIDDYGHWEGARQATDEYFANQKLQPLFCRMDYSARMAIKPSEL